jgi:hypothetical protein
MKSISKYITMAVVLLFLNSIFAQGPDTTLPAIKISPGHAEMLIGEEILFNAVYIDVDSSETDTIVAWSVMPDSLGSMLQTGWFAAEKVGEGFISALLDTLTDTVTVTIKEEKKDTVSYEHQNLVILPRDTLIHLGSQVQFTAQYQDTAGAFRDTNVVWSLDGMPVAEIDTAGVLTATGAGFVVIRATLEDRNGTAYVAIIDSTADTTINTITITRTPQGGSKKTTLKELKTLQEGEIWKIGSLNPPLNILNGGVVYFPPGCLTEDIRLHLELPKFAIDEGDTVVYVPPGVLTGIEFQVFVDSVHQEPYIFEQPLLVGLVFKRGLLRKLEIDPTTLGLYFATVQNDTVVFDPEGLGYTVVDSFANRIYSGVEHFSALAIKGEPGSVVVTAVEPDLKQLPTGYHLAQNYPNPFNPITTLAYSIPEQAHVKLIVYDLLGREIIRLVDQAQNAGTWQVTWNGRDGAGQLVSAGIYLTRITAGDFVQTRKMVLLK